MLVRFPEAKSPPVHVYALGHVLTGCALAIAVGPTNPVATAADATIMAPPNKIRNFIRAPSLVCAGPKSLIAPKLSSCVQPQSRSAARVLYSPGFGHSRTCSWQPSPARPADPPGNDLTHLGCVIARSRTRLFSRHPPCQELVSYNRSTIRLLSAVLRLTDSPLAHTGSSEDLVGAIGIRTSDPLALYGTTLGLR